MIISVWGKGLNVLGLVYVFLKYESFVDKVVFEDYV